MNARSFRLPGAVAAVALAIMSSGCGGGSNDSPTPPGGDDDSVIPASAGTTGDAFVTYVKSLPDDEVADEPKTFAAGFAEPDEDGDEPVDAS